MRICLTTLGLFMAISLMAQIHRGTISTGGSVGMQFSAFQSTKERKFNADFLPDVSFFIAKNTSLGPNVGYGITSNVLKSNNSKVLTHRFLLGPMFRHYFTITPRFYVFSGASVSFTYGKTRYGDVTTPNFTDYNSWGVNWRVGPGFAALLTPSTALEFGPSYVGYYETRNISNKSGALTPNTHETMHGFILNLGFRVFFFKKVLKTSEAPINKML